MTPFESQHPNWRLLEYSLKREYEFLRGVRISTKPASGLDEDVF
jgi:hypothetical protein